MQVACVCVYELARHQQHLTQLCAYCKYLSILMYVLQGT